MLKLRRGRVVEAGDAAEPMQRLVVDVDGERREARADVGRVGPAAEGDDVVVNVEARDLELGSGGFDIVHVNLTRGLSGEGVLGAHVMKLNYTSLQHAVAPVEEGDTAAAALAAAGERPPLALPLARPVGVFGLHGQLAPLAWALGQARPGARVGYVHTAGGALPGGLSEVVRELRARELLCAHVTAGPAYGGEGEAITTAGALHHGLHDAGWDAAVCGPGPGILGSASALGHGGMAALDNAHAAIALGCRTVLVARMSSGDPRPRHRGISHHTLTVLELLLAPVVVALPAGVDPELPDDYRHDVRGVEVDLEGYRASGLPARTMGRELDEDPDFFAAALAAGRALGEMP
jgi:Protein of unknown function (DUF3866)